MPQNACLCNTCSSKAESSRCASCQAFIPSKVGGVPRLAPLCERHARSDSGKMCFLCKVQPAGATPARICPKCASTPAGQKCVVCKGGIDFDDVKKLLGGFRP